MSVHAPSSSPEKGKEQMVWNFPDISLEELMKLIKGFVDIMILASGYQSSGLLAHWDSRNVKNAFQWGSFFENVTEKMSSSDVYQDSVKEFDAALHRMTSDPSFPQGLADLSYKTLSKARSLVLARLFHTLPLRDSHLRAFLMAIIEMDLDKLSESDQDYRLYLNKLTLHSIPGSRDFVKDSPLMEDVTPNLTVGKCCDDDLTKFTLQELSKRQSTVSSISTIETGLDILSNSIQYSNWTDPNSSLFKEQLNCNRAPSLTGNMEHFIDLLSWRHWKSKNLLYFLDKRTVRLVSGASMIFSAPKIQWVQVFERLKASPACTDDDVHETIELLLLGCIASKWNCLIEHFMSTSYNSLPISKLCSDVCNLLNVRSHLCKEDEPYSQESGILEYLYQLLDGKLHPLWKLPPVLAAVAIPSWSPMFRLYLNEIEAQFKGDSLTMRCCTCIQEQKEHNDCSLIERIWCLHIFHVCGSQIMHSSSGA